MPKPPKICVEDIHRGQHIGNKTCIFCGKPIKYYPHDKFFMTDFQAQLNESLSKDLKKASITYDYSSGTVTSVSSDWIIQDNTSEPSDF